MENLYPVYLNIKNRKFLILGGGQVAWRKAQGILTCGGELQVISPILIPEMQQAADKGDFIWLKRKYQFGDLDKKDFVFVAVDNEETSKAIVREAHKKGCFLNVADRPEDGDVFSPAVMSTGSLSIAISTTGHSPSLARTIKNELKDQYDDAYIEYLEFIGKERKKAIQKIKNIEKRRSYLNFLAEASFKDTFLRGEKEEVQEMINKKWEFLVKKI